jgi:glycosyltransferase involved in cell wall biosynthesis
MQFAVNTRFLIPGTFEGFGHYTHEILSRIVAQHPEHGFQFYFDRKVPKEFLYYSKLTGKALFPPARHPILFYLWYQWSLRSALKHSGADIFFSPDSFLPLGMRVPSVITVHDVAHKPFPEAISFAHRKYYDYYMPKFIREAAHIITVSHFSKHEILKYYPEAEGKVDVIYNGVGDAYRPLAHDAQQNVRDRVSEGMPYFLFVGAIHPRKNVAGLINAYAEFRKNSDIPIKLVIIGRKSWDFIDVEEATARSGLRSDIIFTGYIDMAELAKITASALALCYLSFYEGFGLPVAEAMTCGVPVIVTQDSAQSEVAGKAGLAVDVHNMQEVSQAMTRIATDDTLRENLSVAGLKRGQMFTWDTAAAKTYDVLVQNLR